MIIGGARWSNWAGSVMCKPKKIVRPKDEVDLAATVRCAEGAVRAAGGGMSFSPLCATDGTLLDLSAFEGLSGFDAENEVATVGAGTHLWAIASLLHREGYGLSIMGDNDRETLSGAVAAGTHGSGWNLNSMSADVAAFSLVQADGGVLRCAADDNPDIFAAGRTALGLFGMMTEIGMKVRPRFKLVKTYFVHSIEETFRQLDGMMQANRHFEFFWYPYNNHIVCKSLNETGAKAPEPRSESAMRARGERPSPKTFLIRAINDALPFSPSFLLPAAHRLLSTLRKSFGRVRWSNEAFPSPRPRIMRYNEMEYAVPYEQGADAVREVAEAIRKKKIVTGYPIVFRAVAADDIWLSPHYGRRSAAISVHQHWKLDPRPLFETCEAIFRGYNGRPHWGKMHGLTADEAARLYPRYDDFRSLRKKLDPRGKFFNKHLRAIFPE